jgi:hypothetical protein
MKKGRRVYISTIYADSSASWKLSITFLQAGTQARKTDLEFSEWSALQVY